MIVMEPWTARIACKAGRPTHLPGGAVRSSFACGIRRIPEIRHRVVMLHHPVEIVDAPLAGVLSVLEVPPHVDRLDRADLLTHPAEDAAELVDLVDERVAVALVVLAAHQSDAVRRADRGAEPARD